MPGKHSLSSVRRSRGFDGPWASSRICSKMWMALLLFASYRPSSEDGLFSRSPLPGARSNRTEAILAGSRSEHRLAAHFILRGLRRIQVAHLSCLAAWARVNVRNRATGNHCAGLRSRYRGITAVHRAELIYAHPAPGRASWAERVGPLSWARSKALSQPASSRAATSRGARCCWVAAVTA